ncbi:hypothetical protein PFISCL1PPCAC_6945, partial [Pristionchus fissidentatus]
EARRLLSYPGIVVTHALMCLLCAFGTACTAYLSWLIVRHKVFHVNLRWLLTTLNLLLITRSIAAFVRSGYFLLLLTSGNDCDLLWRSSRCSNFADIVSKTIVVMSYAYLAIAIERLLALWLSQRYERSNKAFLGVIGFIAVWFEYAIAFGRNSFLLITDDGLSSPYSVYCMAMSSVNISWVSRTNILLYFICIVYFIISLYCSCCHAIWMNECKHSLTARFQERITYKATRLILPNAIVFSIMYIFSVLSKIMKYV